MTTFALNNLWTYLQGLSLSQSDREWLANKLIMPVQKKETLTKDDALAKFLEMEGIWSEDAEGEEYYQMMKHRNDGRPLNRETNLDDQPIIAELTYGAVHSQNVEKHLREPQIIKENFQVLPIVKDWIDDYVEIRHALATQGLRIGEFDILIAVTARHFGLTVVTHNTKHFSKIPDIHCVDWVNG